jgi:hypothetical protein
MERRTLIRLLVVLGIGIPLLVEGFTFFGLLEAQLLGGGGDATPTPAVDGVTQGEEVLQATTPTDTLSTASLAGNGRPVLTLTVRVTNTGNASYELRLTEVTTREGETVAGSASTGVLPPGESGFATGQWTLPAGARPGSVTVVALVDRDGGTERIERSVTLGRLEG